MVSFPSAGHQHFIAVPHHQLHNFRKAALTLSISVVLGPVQALGLLRHRDTRALWRTQAPLDIIRVPDGAHLCRLAHLDLGDLTAKPESSFSQRRL